MPPASQARRTPAVLWPAIILALVLASLAFAAATHWPGLAQLADGLRRAAWLIPLLVLLHLVQLLLSALGWRALLTGPTPPRTAFWRLRIIREGIDSLLPVAQVGGEVVGFQLLARLGIPPARAAASVIVDVTIELLTQVLFLLAGLCTLAWLSGGSGWTEWLAPLGAGLAAIAGLYAAQRFGGLRALEALLRGMADRWPALATTALDGLHAQALAVYRNTRAILASIALHLPAWVLGALETWAVLTILGVPVTPAQAFTIESLGMAARSAGFAIPAALGAQEGGFVLAAAAVGIPALPALTLSLVKRLREIAVGCLGLALWRAATRTRSIPSSTPAPR